MYRVFLLAVFALLSLFSNAVDARNSDGRFLRVVDSTEERGGLPSYIKASLTKWRIDSKVKSWVRKQKTDEYVLAKLGLNKLTGEALTSAAKYSQFQDFKVGVWLKEGTSTTSVLNTLGLSNLAGGALEKAEGFSTYVKYVMALERKADDYDFTKWRGLFGGGTPEQLKLKRQLLVLAGRNELDLRIMLG
ncbi:hypothetical protein V7S43_015579 [Phytophthora oleae]|uniref:RxLR effector protein n=1 Tax=Phytophthora oleae TaxID=2107226 RepID=A0ABD3EXN8_9STRA